MANTLDNLIPDVYASLDVVSRELTGFLPGVTRDASLDRVASGQSVRVHQAPANIAGKDITPAMALPAAADQVIGNAALTITKSRSFPFSYSGEEQAALDAGPGFLSVKQSQIAQAIRAAVNEMENDVADAAVLGSRAYGTAGTTPFASDLSDSAQVRKILDDNGAPASGRSLVIDTSAGASLRTLSNLSKANESGSSMTLRDGQLLDVHGFAIRESGQVNNATKGTGASYLLNGALAIGALTVTVDGGSGTILAGDIVTIGNHKYVADTALVGGVTFTVASPGIQEIVADNAAITVNATSARNIAFSQDAILLAARLPVEPQGGDLAIMSEVVTDPRTGISFEIRVYPGYRMNLYEIGLAWGVKMAKPAHAAVLLG